MLLCDGGADSTVADWFRDAVLAGCFSFLLKNENKFPCFDGFFEPAVAVPFFFPLFDMAHFVVEQNIGSSSNLAWNIVQCKLLDNTINLYGEWRSLTPSVLQIKISVHSEPAYR